MLVEYVIVTDVILFKFLDGSRQRANRNISSMVFFPFFFHLGKRMY